MHRGNFPLRYAPPPSCRERQLFGRNPNHSSVAAGAGTNAGICNMARQQLRSRTVLALCAGLAAATSASATEYGFSTYGLGGNAFGAGVTPPAGTYVTEAAA